MRGGVVARPTRQVRVERLLDVGVPGRAHRVEDRGAELPQRCDHLERRWVGVEHDEVEDRLSVVLGREGVDRRDAERERKALEVIGRGPHELGELGQHPFGVVEGVDDLPGEHLGPHVVEGELQRGHHTEVVAGSAQPPEQLRVRLRRGRHRLPGHGHQLEGDEVVDPVPERPREPAGAAPQH